MPMYEFNIQLFEDGELTVDHDTFEAESPEECRRLMEEDYAGATITDIREVS